MSRFKELTLSNEEKVTVNLEQVRYIEWAGTCAYRKSSPSILVMESAQDRTAQNAPRWLGGT